MKHVLTVTDGSIIDSIIRVFNQRGFIKVGSRVFRINGYRPGPGVKNWDCEFDLEDWQIGEVASALLSLPGDTNQVEIKPVWNGPVDGLPPVGLEVEVLWSSQERTYVTGKVLAHEENRAVFRFTSGERKGEYQADGAFFSTGKDKLPTFRLIRTAEQRAKDAHRAKYWPQLVELWEADTKREDFLEAVYAMIAEADKS